MDKLISVIGPTASGKTSLAIKIAKMFDGELINTDSRQIYKFLNIGTSKGDLKKKNKKVIIDKKYDIDFPRDHYNLYEIDGAMIHLVNILDPNKTLSLAQYQKLAYCAIENILRRDKLPILVGGTGLYIDSVVQDYDIPKIQPDRELRNKLEKKAVNQLQDILKKLNKTRFTQMNNSDSHNPRRLIRAIEIEKNDESKTSKKLLQKSLDFLFLMPSYTREQLYTEINERVIGVLDRGFLDEVKRLIRKGYAFDTPAFSAIAYPLAKKYLAEKITKDEFLDKWKQYERNYARKQITWFKRYDFMKVVDYESAKKDVKRFLDK